MLHRVIPSLFVILLAVTGCDTEKNKSPFLIIDVNITQPVSATNKLYAVFHISPLPPWSEPWLTISSPQKTIVTPQLNIGDFPFYFEVIYDTNGNDTVDTGDFYQGWYNKIDRTAEALSLVVIPEIEVMILHMDLDTHGLIP